MVDPTYVPDAHCAQLYLYITDECRPMGRRSLNRKNDPTVFLLVKISFKSICGKEQHTSETTSSFSFSECLPKYGIEMNILFLATVCIARGGYKILEMNLLMHRYTICLGYPLLWKKSTINESSLFKSVKLDDTL